MINAMLDLPDYVFEPHRKCYVGLILAAKPMALGATLVPYVMTSRARSTLPRLKLNKKLLLQVWCIGKTPNAAVLTCPFLGLLGRCCAR